jgi:hypothetical protein
MAAAHRRFRGLRRSGAFLSTAAAETCRYADALLSSVGGAEPAQSGAGGRYAAAVDLALELLSDGDLGAQVPIGYNWSYLACRIGHLVPVWKPITGFPFHTLRRVLFTGLSGRRGELRRARRNSRS